ncbi:MAG TPA: hypothetical protein VEF55_09360 [Candidatus Binatia bacterium]|nr:hypothetical protein [Candidatus Binatia bacterium]
MWFVDKLGPAPGAVSAPPGSRANGASQPQAAAPRAQAPAAKTTPTPEPDKKKKKGWF